MVTDNGDGDGDGNGDSDGDGDDNGDSGDVQRGPYSNYSSHLVITPRTL